MKWYPIPLCLTVVVGLGVGVGVGVEGLFRRWSSSVEFQLRKHATRTGDDRIVEGVWVLFH